MSSIMRRRSGEILSGESFMAQFLSRNEADCLISKHTEQRPYTSVTLRTPIEVTLPRERFSPSTAIRLYFDDGDMAAIHTLACAAREIYEKHCKAAGMDRMFDYIQTAHPTRSQKELWDIINGPRNFLKHPEANLDLSATIELDDQMNASMLFMASHDCAMLCKDSQPPEVQSYNLWFMATKFPVDFNRAAPDTGQALDIAQAIEAAYPGLRDAPLLEQKRVGLQLLAEANRMSEESIGPLKD
jgi:hypothetical protein